MDEQLQQAFLRGVYKRASELGLEKEAFVGPLAGMVLSGVAGVGGASLLGRGLTALGAKKGTGFVGKAAKGIMTHANKPGTGFKPLLAQMGLFSAGSMITDPLINPIATKIENLG